MAKNEEWARWLEKDGEHRLFAHADIDAAKADGWQEPTSVRGNGEPWNTEYHEGEGLPQVEALAKVTDGIKAVEVKRGDRLTQEAERSVKSGPVKKSK